MYICVTNSSLSSNGWILHLYVWWNIHNFGVVYTVIQSKYVYNLSHMNVFLLRLSGFPYCSEKKELLKKHCVNIGDWLRNLARISRQTSPVIHWQNFQFLSKSISHMDYSQSVCLCQLIAHNFTAFSWIVVERNGNTGDCEPRTEGNK